MSALRIYHEQDTVDLLFGSHNNISIRRKLAEIGVCYEQWPIASQLPAQLTSETVLAAYQADIKRIQAREGYQQVEVIGAPLDKPRGADLSEHSHSEDEVYFFVAGEGLFSLHVQQRVYEVHCRQGDFIRIPAHTLHWFDMGDKPNLIALRLYNTPDGAALNYSDNPIAERFNRLENA